MTTLPSVPLTDQIDRATWNSMAASAYLPTGQLDLKRANELFDTVLIPRVRHWWNREDNEEEIACVMRNKLREGRLPLVLAAQELARMGVKIADEALRATGADLQMSLVQRQELASGHLQIIAYCQNVLAGWAPQTRSGPGLYDSWMRNVLTYHLITIARDSFGLAAGRNRQARRAERPSAISFVVAALQRNGLYSPSEQSVQQNMWFSPFGDLMREMQRDIEEANRFPQARSTIFPEKSAT